MFQQIHDCLSKHSFNTDAAAAELSRMYNKTSQLGYTGYNQWRQDYDRREAESRNSQLANQVIFEQQQSFKRKASGEEPTRKKKGIETNTFLVSIMQIINFLQLREGNLMIAMIVQVVIITKIKECLIGNLCIESTRYNFTKVIF